MHSLKREVTLPHSLLWLNYWMIKFKIVRHHQLPTTSYLMKTMKTSLPGIPWQEITEHVDLEDALCVHCLKQNLIRMKCYLFSRKLLLPRAGLSWERVKLLHPLAYYLCKMMLVQPFKFFVTKMRRMKRTYLHRKVHQTHLLVVITMLLSLFFVTKRSMILQRKISFLQSHLTVLQTRLLGVIVVLLSQFFVMKRKLIVQGKIRLPLLHLEVPQICQLVMTVVLPSRFFATKRRMIVQGKISHLRPHLKVRPTHQLVVTVVLLSQFFAMKMKKTALRKERRGNLMVVIPPRFRSSVKQ
mmetsp:Transcript_31127/g.45560  ORF Transcript_31127/g.45560 Transcript_31127/m.45560 type:complete len:298 (+) Transcript_31127:1309-2202(+)